MTIPAPPVGWTPPRIRLPRGLPVIGADGSHRAGWPWVLAHLQPLVHPRGMLVDDFIERTFLYSRGGRRPWREPWVGCLHQPPQIPPYFLTGMRMRLQSLWRVPEFGASLGTLRGLIVLSEYLARWVRQTIDLPVCVLKYPTEMPAQRFDLEAYLAAPTLVQVGWYLRNQDAIYQVEAPGHTKIHLESNNPTAAIARDQLRAAWPFRDRAVHGDTKGVSFLPAIAYDILLSRSVMVQEYLDASASTAIVEAIARQMPVVVNRHPAIEEYLGPAYPLFYDDLTEVPALLRPERVIAAHAYLCAMDTRWLSGDVFAAGVRDFIGKVRR